LSVESQINQEVLYGIIPIKRSERIYSFFDIFLVTSGYAIATWCYVHGGYLATMVGFWQFITSTFGILSVGGLFLCLVATIGYRYGIDHWIYTRAVFGYIGVFVVLIAAILSTWGWYAINAQMYGLSIWRIMDVAGLQVGEGWIPWIALTCVFFGWWIAMKGPHAVKLSARIMVPSLLLVGAIIAILIFSTASVGEMVAMEPIYAEYYDNPREPYMLVNEWNFASIFGWLPSIGVLTRLVKRERDGYWGTWLGYALIMACFVVLGALTGLLTSNVTGEVSTDPTEWLITLGGPALGMISLIFIGVANITTMDIGVYSLALSTKILRPSWNYKIVGTLWTLWCAVLVLWGGAWIFYETFIAIVGFICGPVVGLIIADFYVIRRQRVSMKSLYDTKNGAYKYTNGFNIVSSFAFIIGLVAYFLVYDPILFEPRSKIFFYTTATGMATMVSFFSYVILARIPALRSYLLLEPKAIGEGISDSRGATVS